MHYQQNISKCLASAIGSVGVDDNHWHQALEHAGQAMTTVQTWAKEASLPLLHLPQRRDDLEACKTAAELLKTGKTDIFVFGTGGSSLGGQAVTQLAGYRLPADPLNVVPPRLHFFDNLDATTMQAALERTDLATTGFLVISKSGGTPETVIQMIAAIEALKAHGLEDQLGQHMVLLSEPGTPDKNVLRAMAAKYRLSILDHDPGIGGRFSALSNVGLLPAIICGLDAVGFRQGATAVLEELRAAHGAEDCAPAVGAAVNYALARESGITTSIMMPYMDRLRLFSAWFQQLWAESLGKQGNGTQPVAAAGPVDQHSQMQLFLGGPPDKLLNIIMTNTTGAGPKVPAGFGDDPLLGYLAGRTIGDLTDCQQRATIETYASNGRPVRSFTIDRVDEKSVGALMMHFMLETIVMGLMLGIDPFDQPAVEESKILTRAYLQALS